MNEMGKSRDFSGRGKLNLSANSGESVAQPGGAQAVSEAPLEGQIVESYRARNVRNVLGAFSKKYTSLFIDDTSIKLVVIRGKQVVQSAVMLLEPGLVNDGTINAQELVAEKLKSFLRSQKVKRSRIIVGFSGLHCLSRVATLPPLRNSKLIDEGIHNEAERELPVPASDLYLAWQLIHRSRKELKVFYIAYSREIVDSLVQTLDKAGMKRGLMDLAPLAITRIVGQKTAAIVDIRPCGMDIVVLGEGIPLLIRSLPLQKDKTLAEKLPVIREELERTIKFHVSEKTNGAGDGKLPVYVSGILQDDPSLFQSLVEDLGYPVYRSLAPLAYPAQMMPAHFAVNIGLILKKLSLHGGVSLSAININALPQVYRPQPIRLGQIFQVAAVLALAGGVVFTLFLARDAANQTALLQAQATSANQVVTQAQAQQKTLNDSINNIEKEIAASSQTLQSLKSAQASFGIQQEIVNGDLQLIDGLVAANNLKLISFQHDGAILNLTGTAPGEAAVLAFTDSLSKSGRFSAVIVSSISRDEGSGITTFTITSKVED